METLRIAILTETLPPDSLKLQPWRYLGELARALQDAGHAASALTTEAGVPTWNGVRVDRHPAAIDFRSARRLHCLLPSTASSSVAGARASDPACPGPSDPFLGASSSRGLPRLLGGSATWSSFRASFPGTLRRRSSCSCVTGDFPPRSSSGSGSASTRSSPSTA